MREAYNNVALQPSEQGITPYAVSLGHDFCAEHEWGIKKLQMRFGITQDPEVVGIKRRVITKVPEGLQWTKKGDREGILLPASVRVRFDKDNGAESAWGNYFTYKSEYKISSYTRPTLQSAWDEESFFIVSSNREEIAVLRNISDHILSLDIAIGLFGNPFGSGPALIIASSLPETIKESWKKDDSEKLQMQKDFKKSGIEDYLTTHGNKKWFFLGPKMFNGEVKYWLNPMEQDKYHAGWFTLEQLREWAHDRGPVMKSKAEVAKWSGMQA